MRFVIAILLLSGVLGSLLVGRTGRESSQSRQASTPAASQQAQRRQRPMKEGLVEHAHGSGIVTANAPRPLSQAMDAIREEYGWTVDYEDPPYANEPDLVDITDPNWRAAHPGALGARGIAGGAFRSQFKEDATTATSGGEEAALRSIVSDYNSSGNPGKFTVRREGSERLAIVGSSVKNEAGQDLDVPAILDTLISLPAAQRSALECLTAIASELSIKSGKTVHLGMAPLNLLDQKQVTVGGSGAKARDLLVEMLDATGRPLYWRLLFDPVNKDTFFLNIDLVVRAQRDTYGRKQRVPVDLPPRNRAN